MTPIKPLLSAVAVALIVAVPAQAQRAHLGAHAGYNVDRERALVGVQGLIPLTPAVEFYPSVDFSLNDPASRVGINLDLKLRNPAGDGSAWYAGGGLSMLRSSAAGTSDTDAGGSLFAGLESRVGMAHPYVEVRGLLHGRSTVQLVAGVNLSLQR